LNRDSIIGFIGDRGGGKSLGAAATAFRDYLLQGEPVFSNMPLSFNINFSADQAAEYGLQPGIVHYESQPLDIDRLLDYDPEYRGGCIVIDEINIALADARRAMSTQNLYANDIGQQLRKLQSALVYTVIHEMFVDTRVRDMTDIFVSTSDAALTPEGLAAKQQQGRVFKWKIFPMTAKLNGYKYGEGGEALQCTFQGDTYWSSIDTLQRQERTNKWKPGATIVKDPPVMLNEAPKTPQIQAPSQPQEYRL
jgi:hypothetical protein